LVTGWAWRHLPTELLVVTNQWPVERFYILLAGLAVFVASVAIRAAPAPLLGRRWAAGGVLVVALAWSAAEARKFFVRGADAALTEAQSEDLHRPEGIIVSRTHSNEYLGTPPYFSYGHMDPRLEIRLLDPQTREVRADGATLRPHLEGTPPPVRVLDLTETTAGTLADPLTLAAGSAVILRFDFEGSHPDGELQFLGEHLHDSYVLPQSGLSKAFGSEPGNARALVLENSTAAPEHVSLVFLRRSGNRPGVRFGRVSVEPLAESTRAVRLDSLVPLHVHVSAGAGGYLESPRLFVPGYRAIVDGRPAPVWKSSSGLVAVHLDRGEHDVILAYPGGRLLRWTFFGTAFAWLVAIGAVGNQEFINRSIAPAVRAARRNLLGRIRDRGRPGWAAWFPPALGVVALAAFLAWYGPSAPAAPAGYRLVLRLPFVVPGATEPLLTSGRPGAGDFIYVTYIDGTHLVVGHDKWNFGGARSRPFVVDPERDQTLEVDLGGGTPAGARGPVRPVTVRWNGTLLFTDPLGSYPAKPGEVTVGTNLIGGSTTSSRFSGEILATEPLPAR
jgi:hypothetical protein